MPPAAPRGEPSPATPSAGSLGVPDPVVGGGDIREDAGRLLNRELSWLDFNARVLLLAENPEVPLLEQAKFLAIFSQNLDEFFQVRVAGLKDQVAAGVATDTVDGLTAAGQLLEIRDRVDALSRYAQHIFVDQLVPALSDVGIRVSDYDDLDEDDRKHLDEVFEDRVFPVLTPLAVDPGHPFPYISDLSLNLAVVVDDPHTGIRRFARVKVPSLLPRFVTMPDGERFVPLEQVIAAHLHALFAGMTISGHHTFRVTRNADLTLEEEEAEDLLAAVEVELRRRRFGRAVRLEVESGTTPEVLELLVRELDLDDDDVFVHTSPLDLGGLWGIHALDHPALKDPVWVPITEARLAGDGPDAPSFFSVIRDGDVLVHHPYTSFTTSVEEFIRQASIDPKVLAIKLTLYRTSGDSSIIHSLIRAAERGKQVAALVELKARFDEEKNIVWARELEKAGVHVSYGLPGLKIHTKTTLVVRDEPDGIRRYCHIGTGNYNPKTARLYEDLGLFTCDGDIGADLTQLFNLLTGYAREPQFTKLLVSPRELRPRLTALIDHEAELGPRGRIIMKMNSLVDKDIIDSLYKASMAGVPIDLIVRGICCLRPGVPGLSENIRVRSVVGRYLEHSRIYYFAHGGDGDGDVRSGVYYIGSADLMPRNLDRRVEALVPVQAPALQARLHEVLDVDLADDTLAWLLKPDSTWRHVDGEGRFETHRRLQELALERRTATT